VNDFQAIILAAGRGKRLKSLTENIPKCLIKINDNTILDRQIEILFRNGINEIIIVTGYKYQLIKNHINNKNIKIIVNDKFTELDALYSTWLAKKYIKSDFLLLYGDLVFDEKIISSFLRQKSSSSLIIDPIPKNDNHSVIIKNSIIKNISLNSIKNDYSGQFIGICKFTGYDVNLFKEGFERFNEKYDLDGEFIRLIKFLIEQGFLIFEFPTKKSIWINVNDQKSLDLAKQKF